ncbi:MAG: hypothetical protein IPK68_22530 [Bdellovibrionales bacterium]|nr:hypothetical protein [Bdellovibrionales bacterium]
MMHQGQWHDGWFPHWHMWGAWIWPIVIVGLIALIIYFAMKGKSDSGKK